MKLKSKITNRFVLIFEIFLTFAICVGLAVSSLGGLQQEALNYTSEVMAAYETLTADYVRCFKILKMESLLEIEKDLSFEEMLAWAQSREKDFQDAIGKDVYDGFAFTYKGGYVHSWHYGDYSKYVPSSRPWYQLAEKANGEIAVAAPYKTYLSDTDYVEKYDTLRMSIVQKYNDEIYYDFDLNVKEINALIADRHTIYTGTIAFLYDKDGYILSSSNDAYYGHNINKTDAQISSSLAEILQYRDLANECLRIRFIDGSLRMLYSQTNEHGMTLYLLISFTQVFQRNLLFVLLLAMSLLAMELFFYYHTKAGLEEIEKSRDMIKDALIQAESSSHAKGDFMSRMSHEIRTPLNAIIGYLDITQSEQDNPEKISQCIKKSQIASKHLLAIINDVLDISSIESGRMKIAHEPFDIKQMVNALTTLFYAQAKAKGISFEVHVNALKQEWLVGDELRLRQVLLNIMSNAVKFTPEHGSIHLTIKQVGVVHGKIHLQFCVQDTGIGMSKEYMERMFKPFEQESASTAKNYGGTGLGLSICHNLVHMMGGSIHVDSEQGKGTRFVISFAFDPASEEQGITKFTTDSFTHIKALVVDDEPDTCEYIQKILERCGVASDTVTSGRKAIRRIISRKNDGNPYDLCILDWNMAEMDGIETARQIRKIENNEFPIIVATAYDFSSIEEEAKAAGVSKIVSKPLFQSTILNLLVNTFGKYQPKEQAEKTNFDFKGTKLLLAEDNEMNMEIALDILRKAGLEIVPVANGKEALDIFAASASGFFDAILMDIQMPVMDGYTATRKIRESDHPQAKTIPIIAMTANAFTEDVTAALAAGMNDHVAKPISYERLFDALSSLIRPSAQKGKNLLS